MIGTPAMTTRHYLLRLTGLPERQGEIKAMRLLRVLRGLTATAARATQLRAIGSGCRSTKWTPTWVEHTVDFTVTGIKSGSTTVGIAAPCLKETAYDQFSQASLWADVPDLNCTALDLAADAINEASIPESDGNFFDDSVLESILKFGKVGCSSGVRVELFLKEGIQSKLMIDENVCQVVANKKKELSPGRAFVVSGLLDEIRHSLGHFRLIMKGKKVLFGRLSTPSLKLETLCSLWNKQVTVEGMVSFKSDNDARFIEARQIREYTESDALFAENPQGDYSDLRTMIAQEMTRKTSTKVTDLIGLWPGEETAEELLAELHQARSQPCSSPTY